MTIVKMGFLLFEAGITRLGDLTLDVSMSVYKLNMMKP